MTTVNSQVSLAQLMDGYHGIDNYEIFSEVVVSSVVYEEILAEVRRVEFNPSRFHAGIRIVLMDLLVIRDPLMPEDVVWFRNPMMKVDRIVKLGTK